MTQGHRGTALVPAWRLQARGREEPFVQRYELSLLAGLGGSNREIHPAQASYAQRRCRAGGGLGVGPGDFARRPPGGSSAETTPIHTTPPGRCPPAPPP